MIRSSRAAGLLLCAAACCRSGTLAQDSLDACLSAANDSVERGDLSTAESKARACLKLAPNQAPVLAFLGMVLTRENRLAEADPYLEQALHLDASRTATCFNLALNEFRLGQPGRAAPNLERVLRQQPDHKPAALLLGRILAGKGECQRGIALLESVGDLVERQPDTVTALARCYYTTGKRDQARSTLHVLADAPFGPEGIALGAQVASQAGDRETADNLLSAARAKYRDDPRMAYAEALAAYQAGRFSESQAVLERSIAAGSRDPQTFDLLAWCQYRQGHEQRALEAMRHAVELDPASGTRYAHLAEMLAQQHDYAHAVSAAQNAIERAAGDESAWRTKGAAEFAMGLFKQAAESSAKAVGFDAHDPVPLLLLGATQEKLFRYAEAKATLEKGMRLFPNQPRFAVEYGKLLLDPGAASKDAEQRSAVRLLENALAHDDSLAEAHLALGGYFMRTGAAARALPHLVAAAKLAPRDPQSHLLLAGAYRRLGRASDAAEQIRIYQSLQGDARE